MFDVVIICDWSGNSRPKQGTDSIWMARGAIADPEIALVNPATRLQAFQQALGWLTDAVEQDLRTLFCADFAYGFPEGFPAAIGLPHNFMDVWILLNDLYDIVGGGDEENSLNKFAVANELNRLFAENNPDHHDGPEWGRPDWTRFNDTLTQLPADVRYAAPFAEGQRAGLGRERRQICEAQGIVPGNYPHLKMTTPGFPLEYQGGALKRLRLTEERLPGEQAVQETWKIYGAGSVGGQTLCGIPYIYKLLTHDTLGPVSKVWPMTTGFGNPLNEETKILHTEIFPNTIPLNKDLHPIRDACQVIGLVQHVLEKQAAGELAVCFDRPADLSPIELAAVQHQEGWILFS
jgi:precorrin-8X/cobalt-precorrin-8 methylmutase